MNRLKEKYETEIVKKLAEELGIKNPMATSRVTKVVINIGIGEIAKNKEQLEATKRDLALISGQKPATRRSRVSIASFNLRKGQSVGLTVTLRGDRAYDFLDRLFSIVLPRLRDFRGLSIKSFDKAGNYTLGIIEHTIFPEVDVTKISKPFGMEITIVTNAGNPEKARKLLTYLGLPFEK